MNTLKKIAAVLSLTAIGLTGITAQAASTSASAKYKCTSNNQKITAVYSFNGATPTRVALKYRGKTINLAFQPKAANADSMHSFTNGKYTWTTDLFSPADVKSTNGNMLTQGDAIVAKYCNIAK